LLSNAVKFTPEGGAVGATVVRTASGGLSVIIEDTGVGMAPEDIPRAFDRFSQIDGSLTRDYDGAGLGLPLSKLLVEKHGGSVEIVSTVNQGTTVTVCFPPERTLDFESGAEPFLISPDFGIKAAACKPIHPKHAASPCKALSMP
ncbi:MAG: ATP-binding protein, partial [Rhodospirillaceae bacterium]